uniref:Uncharacterized protein n=1 Tax=Hirsutella minnesotensis TaxID=332947 RepID=A0A0U2ET54_9HYPO|nr:hypothetical protein [Hirsutella minnesotensis]AKR17990.1 hypothetical protein [Hirsutella minnesotensis]
MDLFTIALSTMFFYCLFLGYLKPKYIIFILLICVFLYLTVDTVYAMSPKGIEESVDIKISDNTNSISINNSTFNIPETVTKGLTNLGTGAAIAAGVKAGASIAKTTGLSPAAKIGVMTAGAAIAGGTVSIVNAINTINNSKVTTTSKDVSTKPIEKTPPSDAFSMEPSADMETILSLLNANYILHVCIAYLILVILILYTADKVISKKWNLLFIKNIFGETFYNLFIKWFLYTGKYNKIWMGIAWLLLLIASMITLYVSSYILNHIDIISDIVSNK